MNIAICRLMGLALGAQLPPLDVRSVTIMIITLRTLSAQGAWVLICMAVLDVAVLYLLDVLCAGCLGAGAEQEGGGDGGEDQWHWLLSSAGLMCSSCDQILLVQYRSAAADYTVRVRGMCQLWWGGRWREKQARHSMAS